MITDDRLEHVAALQHGAMHQHTTGSADHDRSFAELVTEQRRHRNRPDGFWVASTDPSAAQHALTDTVPRDGLQRAAESSDPDGRRWPRGKRHDASAAFRHLIELMSWAPGTSCSLEALSMPGRTS